MTAARARADYRRALGAVGEIVLFRRYAPGGGSHADVAVRARVAGYAPQALVGALQEGDRRVIALAEDFETPPTLSRLDKIVVRGRECEIVALDDSTRRLGGELVAYEIAIRG